MEKIRSHSSTADFLVPEMATFGVRKIDIQHRYSQLLFNEPHSLVGKEERERHLRELVEFEVTTEGEEEAFGAEHEKRLKVLVGQWSALSPKILNGVFEVYSSSRESLLAFHGADEAIKVTIPVAKEPREIENHFSFHQIIMNSKSDYIGICGACTWDDEHGIGVVVANGELIDVGLADIAYYPSNFDSNVEIAEDDCPSFAGDKKKYNLIWDGEFEVMVQLPTSIRDYIVHSVRCTCGKEMNGIHAQIVAECSNASIEECPSYAYEDIVRHYGFSLDVALYFENVRKFSNKKAQEIKRMVEMLGEENIQIANEMRLCIEHELVLPSAWDSYRMLDCEEL